jgi:hypothetical protein
MNKIKHPSMRFVRPHKTVGDYANISNYLPARTAVVDAGAAELHRLFEQVNKRLAALSETDRALLAPAVEQTVQAVAEIQQGDVTPEKERFLAERLKHIYNMSSDIS